MSKCSETDCLGAHYAKGFCKRHYDAQRPGRGQGRGEQKPLPVDRLCPKCGITKLIDDFGLRKTRKGNLTYRHMCRQCDGLRVQARPAADRNAYARGWEKRNREKRRLKNQRYRENNREKVNARQRAWEARNPEKLAIYYQHSLPAFAAATSRRRARVRGNGFEKYSRRAVFDRDDGNCWLCGQPIDWELSGWDRWGFTVDHVIPVSLGGPDIFMNVRAAHRSCNSSRKTKEVLISA